MSKDKDVRDFSINRASPHRVDALNAQAALVSQGLPGSHHIRIAQFDATTGNPSAVVSEAAPAAPGGDYVKRALEHVHAISPALGLTAQAPEFAADPVVQETSSGARAVNLHQRYKGISVFQAAQTVRFAPDGALVDSIGTSVSADGDVPVSSKLSVEQAVRKAAEYVAAPDPDATDAKDPFGSSMAPPSLDITGFQPKVEATFPNLPEQPAVLARGPFGAEIRAHRIWFKASHLKLAWEMLLTMPTGAGQYTVIVDANDGEILFCKQMVQTVAAVGNVFRVDGGRPRQMTSFPLPAGDYPVRSVSVGQNEWRWCHKCEGLFFNGHPTKGRCPTGGAHDSTGSGNYRLVQNAPEAEGQQQWRWCHKCEGLYFGGHSTKGVCPADGAAHDVAGSGNYVLMQNAPLSLGQSEWRWCRKCEGLHFHGHATHGICPAGGAHDSTGSGNYTLVQNGPDLPVDFPDTWVAASRTIGNSANAHLSAAGASYEGAVLNNVLTFNPADQFGDDQKVLNIFFYNCYIHDFFYLLGFREADGNFQSNNFGRGGVAGDAVDARSWPGAVFGTANMAAPVDGSSPTMNMGMVTSTNRHTAFDSTVVFHEFTHGVTNRLVGGPMNVHALDAIQSGGMGEGWGDYVACTINNVTVVGNWVVDNAAGIRGFPYDANFPDGFGRVGQGRYNEVHNLGEIWCATLMELNRRTDKHLALQLVVDALKLSPANPSFLDMRSAIASALQFLHSSGKIASPQRDAAWQGMWSTFARFGMGRFASSSGAQLTGIVADQNVGQPNWRWCNKCQGLSFAGNLTPGQCPAGGNHDHAGSGNYDLIHNWIDAPGQRNWRWCNKCQGLAFGGNANLGPCPAGGNHDHAGSGDYRLIQNAPGAWGQANWRWCNKCQGLSFAGNATLGQCPAGGQHDHNGSGNYVLIHK